MSLFDLFNLAEAWASSAGAEHHAPSINQIWFPLINFLIFAYLIQRYALPLVRGYLLSRREEVVAAIKTAAEDKQRAEAMVQDYKTRLARLNEETTSIQDVLRAEGEREKARLLSEAEAMAVKMKSDARFLADQEIKVARQELRREMTETARAAAIDLVRRHISAADQSRLVEDFIQSIGQAR